LAKEDSLFHLVKADGEENFEKRYSLKGDLLLLASLKADNANYGSESLLLRDLKANLDSLYVPYHPDNQHPEYHESLKKLSFSSLTDFARCPYSYLIKRIYQIQDEEDENLNLPKGTFFHYLVETHEKGEDVSEEQALDACRIDKSKLAEKDAFYFHKIFLSAQLFCQELDQMKNFAGLDSQVKAELPFEYSLNNGEILKGKIDAVLIGPKDYLILDYKTGEHLFSYDEALIGLDMQLPLYASALKRNEELKGKTDVGFLFAMPFPKKFLYSFVPAMTLSGCYSLDEKGAKLIFSFASDSERLGTYISSRANKSSPLTMEQLIEKVEGQINLLSSRIQEGKFPVVQKRLVKSNGEASKEFCQFCPYLDCCYLDTDDERQVEKVPLIRDAGEEEEEQ
jgi:ATP-dependent helicase/DNAse subunit B